MMFAHTTITIGDDHDKTTSHDKTSSSAVDPERDEAALEADGRPTFGLLVA